MIIQHNIPALNSHRQLGINNSATSKNLEKLSSGYRINRAGDDAAGLAISEKMRGQIRGLAMAEQNTSNGISLIQTAEGGLNETHAILQRMRELAVQSANGTYDNEVDRYNLNKEVVALKSEIDRISQATHYNGIDLLNGTTGGAVPTDGLEDLFGSTFDSFSIIDPALQGLSVTFIVNRDSSAAASIVIGDKTYLGFVDGDKISFIDVDGAGYEFIPPNTHQGIEVAKIEFDSGTGVPNTLANGVISNVQTTAAGALGATAFENSRFALADQSSQLTFQIGANGTADQQVGIYVANMSTSNLGNVDGTTIALISIATQDNANAAIEVIDAAINQVSSTRSDLGALQNRLEHTLNNLGVTKENLTAAESTIRDVDMAKEMMEYTKNTILVQASQAMLAQAQQLPQGVLQLLR